MRISGLDKYYSTLFLVLTIFGCDASRHNPLDPSNPNNKLSILSGIVYTQSAPPAPISNVNVFWQPAGRTVQTNSNGEFSFDDLVPADGWLSVSKSGFSPDSIHIKISEKEQKSREFFLNSKPILESLETFSKVVNRYGLSPKTTLMFKVIIRDADNDIDSVFIANDLLGICKALDYNAGTRQYEKTFSPFLLGVKNLEQIVGHDFEIKVKDLAGVVYAVGTTQLKRIIHQQIQFDTPANSQQVTGQLELVWNFFEPGFDFTYIVGIFTDELFYQELVWEKSDISPELNSLVIEPDLPAGNYFWVIWCVDEYGNRSQSKPATFRISDN